jgi:protoporphyrinogen oxidase
MSYAHAVILGGGMSGLSCAYHLKKDYALFERSDEPGGLSRSVKQDGFIYDHTGHLLHLRNPYTLKLIPELLKDNLNLLHRSAWIYSHNTYTPYPYQANLGGLPKNVIRECLTGLVNAQLAASHVSTGLPVLGQTTPESMKSWVLRTFGKGFAKHFFFPYNEKLWTVTADILTAEWVAPFVPRPTIQDVMDGILNDPNKVFGYNATFYYPKRGGIQSLAFAMADGLPELHLNSEATSVDLDKKEIRFKDGRSYTYKFLVSSLPLVRLLRMIANLPPKVREDSEKLRWSSVYNINFGINRPRLSDKHWIYFPEKKYMFYRVGFPMNFAPAMTPPNCSSMYVEIAHQPQNPVDEKKVMKATLKGLKECGLIENEKEIISTCILKIPVAYVTYDVHRTAATGRLLAYLESKGVYSIGRFGGWKYSYMEEAILEGQQTAEKILGQ